MEFHPVGFKAVLQNLQDSAAIRAFGTDGNRVLAEIMETRRRLIHIETSHLFVD
jgi:hypothetical protein